MPKKKDRPLSTQQQRFAELVVSGRPAGRAYEEAGYSARGDSADVSASKLLRNPKVEEYVAELRGRSRSASVKTAQEVKEGLSRLMDMAELDVDYNGYVQLANRLAKMEGFDEPEKIELDNDVRVIIGGDK